MKNPSNYRIKSFARLKKITTLIFKKSVAFIVNLFGGFTYTVPVFWNVCTTGFNLHGDPSQAGPAQCRQNRGIYTG